MLHKFICHHVTFMHLSHCDWTGDIFTDNCEHAVLDHHIYNDGWKNVLEELESGQMQYFHWYSKLSKDMDILLQNNYIMLEINSPYQQTFPNQLDKKKTQKTKKGPF